MTMVKTSARWIIGARRGGRIPLQAGGEVAGGCATRLLIKTNVIIITIVFLMPSCSDLITSAALLDYIADFDWD